MKRSTPVEPRAEIRPADESRVTIRPVEPTDKPLLAGALAELSEESRYRQLAERARAEAPDDA